jgi:hypothetical protein
MSLQSLTRLLAVVLALAWLSPAAEAEIRPLTIRDAVGMSTFGAASIDPTGRWAVYEKRGPYDTAPAYDRLLRSNWSITDLWIASTDGSGLVGRLLPDGEGGGLLLGAWSPDGDWLLIYRLRDDRLEPGVIKVADRSVWWTGLAAEWGVTGAVAAWIDDDHLGLTIHPGGELAYLLRQPGSVQRAMPGRWAAQKAGREPTRTIFDTDGGVATSDTPEPANAVVSLDVRRQTTAILAEGLVRDWAVSPDGRDPGRGQGGSGSSVRTRSSGATRASGTRSARTCRHPHGTPTAIGRRLGRRGPAVALVRDRRMRSWSGSARTVRRGRRGSSRA